jgi:protein-S-isoprenylcysteine O-methyltransferase Ste14
MAPFGLFLLIFGRPSFESFFIGLGLCAAGEFIRIWGVGYAGISTRKSYLEAESLITAGPFRYVRHPLYLGNSLIGLGGTVMAAGRYSGGTAWIFFLVWLVFYVLVYGTLIPLEESFLETRFGEIYQIYRKKIPLILPTFTAYSESSGKYEWEKAWRSEIHTLIPLLIVILLMFLKITYPFTVKLQVSHSASFLLNFFKL